MDYIDDNDLYLENITSKYFGCGESNPLSSIEHLYDEQNFFLDGKLFTLHFYEHHNYHFSIMKFSYDGYYIDFKLYLVNKREEKLDAEIYHNDILIFSQDSSCVYLNKLTNDDFLFVDKALNGLSNYLDSIFPYDTSFEGEITEKYDIDCINYSIKKIFDMYSNKDCSKSGYMLIDLKLYYIDLMVYGSSIEIRLDDYFSNTTYLFNIDIYSATIDICPLNTNGSHSFIEFNLKNNKPPFFNNTVESRFFDSLNDLLECVYHGFKILIEKIPAESKNIFNY